ncbi:hypothetical protein [Micromonospora narathiwatensis]|uniref:Uncharacterized protein n=1 Tax=Micromonospora narathiwatensis TaxID=299146 RepID=A0A1A8ZBW7_9ACTN|nr:hypothetical protein [Micromonospora narathiwatensis]SBT41471.1 hypothetical protein GA0070621_1245 [Micromonospora narathiwatensis]
MSILPTDRRVSNYRQQSRRPQLTPRQRRRVEHKEAKVRRLTGQRPEARRP